MSTLQVANVWLESTGTNKIGYRNDGRVYIESANGVFLNSQQIYPWEVLSPKTSVSGATVTISNIPPGYDDLMIAYGSFKHNSSNPAYLKLEVSNTNTSTWETVAGGDQITFDWNSAQTETGRILLFNANGAYGQGMGFVDLIGLYSWIYSNVKHYITPVSAIRLSMNAGSIISGNVTVYGMKYNYS